MSTVTSRVAEEVRSMAARKRYSQTQVAGVLGCSQAAVSRLFRAQVPFDVVQLDKLAAEWEVPITKLLGWDEKTGRRTTDEYVGDRHPALQALYDDLGADAVPCAA